MSTIKCYIEQFHCPKTPWALPIHPSLPELLGATDLFIPLSFALSRVSHGIGWLPSLSNMHSRVLCVFF